MISSPKDGAALAPLHQNATHNRGARLEVPMNERLDFQAIAAAALGRAELLVPQWLPEGKRQGHEWTSINPTRADAQPGSFAVNLTTGKWGDFATEDKGGDLISLLAYLEGMSQASAARKLREIVLPGTFSQRTKGTEGTSLNHIAVFGSLSGSLSERNREPARELPPIPRHAQDKRPAAHRTHGKPTATWTYRNNQGEPIAYVCRFDPPEGRKQYCPQTWDPDAKLWRWQAPPVPRPLYGLDRLAARPEALVIITEGEKAADACQALFPVAAVISSMNGAQSPGKSDWRPLAGRQVRIWPDADEPGAQYAAAVAKRVSEAGSQAVEILDIASLARNPATGATRELVRGWDAADALADGWTPATIAAAAVWSAEIFGTPKAKATHPEVDATDQGTGEPDPVASATDPGTEEPTAKRAKLPKPEVTRPSYVVHPEWTGYGKPGLYWHTRKDRGEEVEYIDTWVCSPLWADAVTASERESDFGLLLRFRNALGHEREWSMPMRLLRGSGEELRGELLDLGVRIDPACHRLLNSYLMSRVPPRRVLAATATGWHADGQVFVMPDATLGEGEVRYQSEHAHHDEFATSGTLSGWQTEIAARCVGNPALTFAVSAALAGPLLAKIQRPGCGFHLLGDSSSGKTTLLHAAASCWGGAGFIRTWQATAAGLEGIAAAVTDTALVLDEISEADPRTIGSVIYQLGNGTGKSRGARTGGARAVQRWRVILLSSGERSLAATMAEGGKAPKAGMEIRLLDIPCSRAAGVFDHIHDQPSARAFSDALRTSAARHHGHAGPELVKRIIASQQDYGEVHARLLRLPLFAGDNALEGRAAHAFALVAMAGELAAEWGIVPWSEGTAIDAAAWAYGAWRDGRPKGQGETTQILRAVSDFLARHGDSRFSSLMNDGDDRHPIIRDRCGWWRDTDQTRVFLFTPGGLREASAGFDFRRALKALDSAGWIIDRDPSRNSKKVKVQGRSLSLYAVAIPEEED